MLLTLAGLIFGKPKHVRMLSHRILEIVGVVMDGTTIPTAPTEDAHTPWRRRRMLSSIAWLIFGSTSMTCAAVHRRRASSLLIRSRVWFTSERIEFSSSMFLSGKLQIVTVSFAYLPLETCTNSIELMLRFGIFSSSSLKADCRAWRPSAAISRLCRSRSAELGTVGAKCLLATDSCWSRNLSFLVPTMMMGI